MPTLKQIEANRLNTQKEGSGTGDRLLSPVGMGVPPAKLHEKPAGEASDTAPAPNPYPQPRFFDPVKSPLVKSGLDAESQFVLGESREDFAQLQSEWYDYHAPANPEERLQVDTIIRSEWFLRRFFRIEAQLWEFQSMKAERGTGFELGEAFSKASIVFTRFQRRITLAEKSGKEARAELDRLKALRQPQQTTAETQQMGSFLTTPKSPATVNSSGLADPVLTVIVINLTGLPVSS